MIGPSYKALEVIFATYHHYEIVLLSGISFCSASDSAYSYASLHSVVYPTSVCLSRLCSLAAETIRWT